MASLLLGVTVKHWRELRRETGPTAKQTERGIRKL